MRLLRNGTLTSFRKLAVLTGLFLAQPGFTQPIFNITTLNTSLNASLGGSLGITYNVQNTSGIALTNVVAKPPAGALLSPATTCGRATLANNASCSVVFSTIAPLTTGSWLLNPLVVCTFGGAVCSANLASYQLALHAQPANLYTVSDSNLAVIDTGNNTFIGTTALNDPATGLAISPNGSRLYAVINTDDSVSVIDTKNHLLITTIAVGIGPSPLPWGILVTPDNSKVYVANDGDNTVSVIDTALNTVIATIGVGSNPIAMTVTPDGSKVYVANESTNDVSVISTASDTVISTISGAINNPSFIIASPISNKVYVAARNDDTVVIIDTISDTRVGQINVGDTPVHISLSSAKRAGYVANRDGDSVSVFNMNIDSGTSVAISTGVGSVPIFSAVTPNGKKLYVNTNSGDVIVIDTASNTVLTSIPAIAGTNLVFNAAGSRVYVENGATVYVVNTATDIIEATIPTQNGVGGGDLVAITP